MRLSRKEPSEEAVATEVPLGKGGLLEIGMVPGHVLQLGLRQESGNVPAMAHIMHDTLLTKDLHTPANSLAQGCNWSLLGLNSLLHIKEACLKTLHGKAPASA